MCDAPMMMMMMDYCCLLMGKNVFFFPVALLLNSHLKKIAYLKIIWEYVVNSAFHHYLLCLNNVKTMKYKKKGGAKIHARKLLISF